VVLNDVCHTQTTSYLQYPFKRKSQAINTILLSELDGDQKLKLMRESTVGFDTLWINNVC
jgi:uncharacterized beta-barrel protein YwiB (DUF1934 family)